MEKHYNSLGPKYIKVIIIGDKGVGKTSIKCIYLLNNKENSDNSPPSESFGKDIMVSNTPIKLNIWDSNGKEVYRPLCPVFYRNSDIVLVVFDRGNRDSFDNVDSWIQEAKLRISNVVSFIIVGNTSDSTPKVSIDEGVEKALEYNFVYTEVCTATGQGIELLFDIAVRNHLHI